MSLSKQDFNVADVILLCKIVLSNPRYHKDYVSESTYDKGRMDLANEVLKTLGLKYNSLTGEMKKINV